MEWLSRKCQKCIWTSERRKRLCWCDSGLWGWSAGGGTQGNFGCFKSFLPEATWQKQTSLSPPQASPAVINPSSSYLRIREKSQSSRYSLFQAILQGICTSRYKNMYIKSSESKSWHKKRSYLTERVWSPGYTVPDERVVHNQTYTKMLESFQGWIF